MTIHRPRSTAIAGAVVAILLFVASLTQMVIVKFPVEGEILMIENLLEQEVSLSAASKQAIGVRLGYIRGNHSKVGAAYNRLYFIATVGFLGLAVFFGLLAKSLKSNRHENALASAREG